MKPTEIKVSAREMKLVDIDALDPLQGNLKSLSKQRYQELKREIAETGFAFPLHVWKDGKRIKIIGGHQRVRTLQVMREEGFKIPLIPAVFVDADDEKMARRRVLQDIMQFGEIESDGYYKFLHDSKFDPEEIQQIVQTFEMPSFDNKKFVAEYFEPTQEPVADEIPEPPKNPITRAGDIWTLGGHRLMCGDSTILENVRKLMRGEKPTMVFTDPPYGVDFEAGKFTGQKPAKKHAKIANDDKKGEELRDFVRMALINAAEVSDVCSIYVWSAPLLEGAAMLQAVVDAGWHVQSQLIWNKSALVMGRADYHWKHEICWYGYKGVNHVWEGGRDKTTVWEAPKAQANDLHPTMKPIELSVMACKNSTRENDVVLDLFAGSGSTLLGCEQTKRRAFVMELEPRYCDVILKRWADATGGDPERHDGSNWRELCDTSAQLDSAKPKPHQKPKKAADKPAAKPRQRAR